jgi:hypothetical protein
MKHQSQDSCALYTCKPQHYRSTCNSQKMLQIIRLVVNPRSETLKRLQATAGALFASRPSKRESRLRLQLHGECGFKNNIKSLIVYKYIYRKI